MTANVLHGTAVALGNRAALIRGGSGCGKSDLALRCLAVPAGKMIRLTARLVADDQVIVTPCGSALQLTAPATLRGKLEVRGIGIVEVMSVAVAQLVLLVDLVSPERVERMPERHYEIIKGVSVAGIKLAPFEASSPLKLLLCLQGVSL